jgi:hypothetical protein
MIAIPLLLLPPASGIVQNPVQPVGPVVEEDEVVVAPPVWDVEVVVMAPPLPATPIACPASLQPPARPVVTTTTGATTPDTRASARTTRRK